MLPPLSVTAASPERTSRSVLSVLSSSESVYVLSAPPDRVDGAGGAVRLASAAGEHGRRQQNRDEKLVFHKQNSFPFEKRIHHGGRTACAA